MGGSSDLASVGELWRLVMVIWPAWVSLEVGKRESLDLWGKMKSLMTTGEEKIIKEYFNKIDKKIKV